MTRWFTDTIVDNGRLPLFFLMVAFVLTFLFIRMSTRMIRAEVSWWPGNVTPGGLHIHHVIFGLVTMLVSGLLLVALAAHETPVLNCVLATFFGIGSALVLDEFALVLHVRDVYWSEEGRSSIDAVMVAFAISVLFLLGIHPLGLADDFDEYTDDGEVATLIATIAGLTIQYGLAAITLLKGKFWTGFLGLFFPPLLIAGAIRLSRPTAPWARWRYRPGSPKLAKAAARETRYREPVVRAKIAAQEFVSGRFTAPEPAVEPETSSAGRTGGGQEL
ncbi:hypothetical protein [Nocardia cyriacigeorgica]|uniref:hypothetical protein n=1 Tax=Nocardia cyriacigeorgica TaxID=135487 RepID=UPI0002D67712|nr:hypothetical protein [Nocardia cyriacigeorgica]AVH23667.1 hypothetical protein C5B73_21805 [Nocardia cyriacigeorgica]TLF56252.1 hypothetical protein FEK31_16730 [Nocardia cyriacigeorgica]